MLTSLVTLAGGNKNPGKGFFTLAEQEGFYDPARDDELGFWQGQVRLAHEADKQYRP